MIAIHSTPFMWSGVELDIWMKSLCLLIFYTGGRYVSRTLLEIWMLSGSTVSTSLARIDVSPKTLATSALGNRWSTSRVLHHNMGNTHVSTFVVFGNIIL